MPPPRRQRPGLTAHTTRVIIAVRAPLQAQANDIARQADPATDGDTFNVGYRHATDTSPDPAVVAYIADWSMTPGQLERLRAEHARRYTRAPDVIPPGGDVDPDTTFAVFDAAWGLDNVLDDLNLARIPTSN